MKWCLNVMFTNYLSNDWQIVFLAQTWTPIINALSSSPLLMVLYVDFEFEVENSMHFKGVVKIFGCSKNVTEIQ